MSHPFAPLARELAARSVRYVLIGVSGANFYAPAGQAVFTTQDFDLFLPPDPDNLVRAWAACAHTGLELWLVNEPLDRPRDRWLAERMIQDRTLTRASGPDYLEVDFTLVMKAFDLQCVEREARVRHR